MNIEAIAAMAESAGGLSDDGATYRYSPSTRGFYASTLDYPTLPDDLIELTSEQYETFKSPPNGMSLELVDGTLTFVAAAPLQPSQEQVIGHRNWLLGEAAVRIAPLQDAVDLDDASADEVAALKAWKQYRVALNRIEQQAGFPTQIDWPKAPA